MKHPARTTLGIAFLLSVVVHIILLTFIHGAPEPQPDESFPIAFESSRPIPTPKPTPRPAPTPRPTPRPTAPPHRTFHAPPRRHAAKVARQLSRPHSAAGHAAPPPGSVTIPGGEHRNIGAGDSNGTATAAPVVESGAPETPEPTAPPTPPPACAQPNVPAATVEPAVPETPALAAQQGISGDVTVVVSLDERSRVTGARVVTSPSTLLNDAAVRAARASTFRTEVRDCRPVAADYAFIVEFTAQ